MDGIAGPKTKKQVTAPKFDNAKQGGDVQLKPLTQRNYLWELEDVPGYLDLAQVCQLRWSMALLVITRAP